MRPADLQRLHDKYRLLTDEALAELHLEGPEAYADPDGWRVLDDEYRSRGERGDTAQTSVLAGLANRDEVTSAVAPLYLRLGAAVVDIAVCVVIMSPFIVAGIARDTLTVPVLGLLLATFVYLPITEWKWQATIGKRLVRLAVVREDGAPPTIPDTAARALARFVAWGIVLRPSVVLHVHEPAVLLNDVFSKTRVIRPLPQEEPPG